MSHPFEGWSAINEDWDSGGTIEVNDILANIKTTARNFAGPVAFVLFAMWAAKLLLSVLIGSLMIVGQVAEVNALFTVSSILIYLGYLLVAVISLIQMSLYRPIQLQAFEGREFVGSMGEAVNLAKEVIGKVAIVTLMYGFANFLGAIFCLIGAIIPFFFFSQGPYLAATTELSPWECMRRSYELSKAYYMPVLAAIASTLFLGVLLNGCGGAIVGVIGGLLQTVSPGASALVISLGTDVFSVLSACGLLIISGAIFTSIQSVERSMPVKR